MLHLSWRQSLLLLLFVAISLTAIGQGCYRLGLQHASTQEMNLFPQEPVADYEPSQPQEIIVHVCGEVKRPGVYRLKAGMRVAEAIKLAGGETAKGDRHALNLAQRAKDGERIYVPSKEETRLQKEAEWARLKALAHPPALAEGKLPAPGVGLASEAKPGLRVSINRATVEEWMQLPGIGPVLAQRIVEWRQEHGNFTQLEDLLQIPGIGERIFEKIRPYLTLE